MYSIQKLFFTCAFANTLVPTFRLSPGEQMDTPSAPLAVLRGKCITETVLIVSDRKPNPNCLKHKKTLIYSS